MSKLDFFQPISAGGDSRFKAIEFFDDFFTLAPKTEKFEVISPCQRKDGFLVQKVDVEQSVGRIALKALGWATLVVPIIMFVGKLIAHAQYDFYTSDSVVFSSNQPIYQDAQDSVIQQATDAVENFKEKALDTFAKQQPIDHKTGIPLTKTQVDQVLEAHDNRYFAVNPAGIKVERSNKFPEYIYYIDSAPDLRFIPMKNLQEAQDFQDKINQAIQCVADNDLYLLHIPTTQICVLNGAYFIAQETTEIVGADRYAKKGAYRYCWQDDEMLDYSKELHNQLLTFIIHTNFSRVNYNNIPLTTEGRIALFNPDQKDLLIGLTGDKYGNVGFFNMLPADQIDDFAEIFGKIAQDVLDDASFKSIAMTLTDRLPQIKQRAQQRADKEQRTMQYLQNNGIVVPAQQFDTAAIPKLFNDPKRQEAAKAVLNALNAQLSQQENFNVALGRKVFLSTNSYDSLYNTIQSIWQNHGLNIYGYVLDPNEDTIYKVIKEVMQALQDADYVRSFEINDNYNFIKATC